jgi:hypothetical protein
MLVNDTLGGRSFNIMAAYPALGRVGPAIVAVSGLTITERLTIVVTRAASKLPGEVRWGDSCLP